jgi:hypothetical protein
MASQHVEYPGSNLRGETREKSGEYKKEVAHVNTASVALASAVASQKPKLFGRNMLKLYAIMSVGYLISSMNGFGKKTP